MSPLGIAIRLAGVVVAGLVACVTVRRQRTRRYFATQVGRDVPRSLEQVTGRRAPSGAGKATRQPRNADARRNNPEMSTVTHDQ